MILLYLRYHLLIGRGADSDAEVNMKMLRFKSISAIWVFSFVLCVIHTISIVVIPNDLRLVTEWVISGLVLLPILISMIIYCKMKRQMKRNHVQSIEQDNPDRERIDVLESGYQPYVRKEADMIFTGRQRVKLTVPRLCVKYGLNDIAK